MLQFLVRNVTINFTIIYFWCSRDPEGILSIPEHPCRTYCILYTGEVRMFIGNGQFVLNLFVGGQNIKLFINVVLFKC